MLARISELTDIVPGLIWIVLILLFGHFYYRKKGGPETAKYYLSNLYFKLLMAVVFVISYAIIYGGGDTMAYFQGSENLDNLFFHSPVKYLNELNTEPSSLTFYNNFNNQTGYPPGWIYREPESFVISKIISFLSFITYKSYWAITFILAFLVAHTNYKLFKFIKTFDILPVKITALCILFIPSVSFWCTGISKDTVVYITILIAILNGIKILTRSVNIISKEMLYFILSLLLLSQIRTFLLISILVPLFLALNVSLARFYKKQRTFLLFIRVFVITLGLGSIFLFTSFSQSLGALSPDKILKEAQITQQDFAQNKTYGTDRYDLGITDFSVAGLVKISPQAIVAGIYRPFPWEGLKVALLMNIFESFVLIALTILFFFRRDFFKRLQFLREYEFLIFSLYFVLILSFMTGFSSGLFGVLVRLRAPLLPFAFIFLCAGIWGLNHKKEN